jgi:serpin B
LELPNAKRLSVSGREVDDAMKSVNADTMLEIENTLWPDKSLKLPKDYLARIGAGYRGKLISLDYAANPDSSRITINSVVAHMTHGRINDLISPDGITEKTKLVLTNAVYFKSTWKEQFDESHTHEGAFYNSDQEIQTQMMHKYVTNGRVCVGKDFAFHDFAFKSSETVDDSKGAYVMRIILPNVHTSRRDCMDKLEVVEKLLSNDYTQYCKNSTYDSVFVTMPKFKLAPDSISLTQMLQAMGMNRAFGGDAEFYAMSNTTKKPRVLSSYLTISDY